MVKLLESKGVGVFSLCEDTKNVDAFSCWRGERPFVFLNTFKSTERSRFDAAHELGHLVMHADIDTPRGRDREHEANRFAAAFLIPEDDVLAQGLRNAGVDQVLAAKERWGVAAMALAHRLHDLGVTSDWTYAMTCRRLSELGYRRGEPDESPPNEREASQVLEKAFSLLRSRGMGQSDVAAALRIHPADLQDLLFGLTLTAVPGVGVRKGQAEQPMLRLVSDGG
jgi:Zn-dependent peptidase ImmA (M78 family)